MIGGKLLDQGMYGCVFIPSLECKNTKKHNVNTLSKIILKDDAEFEFSISKIIHKIPLWKNYFTVSESICEPSKKQKDSDLKKCDVLKDFELSDFRILTMPYGGTPLNLHKFNLQDFNFMSFVKHLIESTALLNLFGIVHRDLHQGNILVDKSNIPRIIDFNLAMFVENDITSSMLSHSYDYTITQEPPDSTLVNAISKGYNFDTVINNIIYKKSIVKKISNVLHISHNEMLTDLNNFYNISKSIKSGNLANWFATYWRTIDSWAIGVIIVDLIIKLSMWSNFSSDYKRYQITLIPILKRLCSVDPIKRIDCVQALNYLEPNNFIIRKYASTWLNKVGDGNIH